MEVKNKIFMSLFLLIALFISCYTNVKNNNKPITGVYEWNNNSSIQSISSLKITLYNSEKVLYRLNNEIVENFEVKGSWLMTHDTLKLVFNAPVKVKRQNLEIDYLDSNKINGVVSIHVYEDDKKTPLVGSELLIDNEKILTDNSGSIRINPKYIEKITVKGIGLNKKEILIQKRITNDIKIIYNYDQYRETGYDLIIDNWKLIDEKLYPITDGKINMKKFLVRLGNVSN